MDIRFLKGLTPNVGYLFPKHLTLSKTPCLDIVSIGIGQIIKNHAVYVPIHGLNSPYHTKKIVSQEGGAAASELNTFDPSKNLSENGELETLNKNKKQISQSVKTAFQHPIIKTKTLMLNSKKKIRKPNFKFKVIN